MNSTNSSDITRHVHRLEEYCKRQCWVLTFEESVITSQDETNLPQQISNIALLGDLRKVVFRDEKSQSAPDSDMNDATSEVRKVFLCNLNLEPSSTNLMSAWLLKPTFRDQNGHNTSAESKDFVSALALQYLESLERVQQLSLQGVIEISSANLSLKEKFAQGRDRYLASFSSMFGTAYPELMSMLKKFYVSPAFVNFVLAHESDRCYVLPPPILTLPAAELSWAARLPTAPMPWPSAVLGAPVAFAPVAPEGPRLARSSPPLSMTGGTLSGVLAINKTQVVSLTTFLQQHGLLEYAPLMNARGITVRTLETMELHKLLELGIPEKRSIIYYFWTLFVHVCNRNESTYKNN